MKLISLWFLPPSLVIGQLGKHDHVPRQVEKAMLAPISVVLKNAIRMSACLATYCTHITNSLWPPDNTKHWLQKFTLRSQINAGEFIM